MAAQNLFESTEDMVSRQLEELAEDPSGVQAESAPHDPRKKSKRFKKADFNLRTKAFFENEFEGGGWFMCRADQQKVNFKGAIFTLDFLGLFDWLAFKGGAFIGVQITSKDNIGAHVTEMCSHKETTFNRDLKRNNLERWLREGGRAIIVGWEKPGRLWEATIREVTPEEIAKADARRSKRDGSANRAQVVRT